MASSPPNDHAGNAGDASAVAVTVRTGPTGAAPTGDEVTELLRSVVDPELGADIVDLGMARDVEVSESGDVTLRIALTISGCPLRGQIRSDIVHRLESHPGVGKVKIIWDEMTQPERTAVMQRARLRAVEHAPETEVSPATRVLAIASGKGGVGKSSVTVNLAVAMAGRGFTVGVLDADIWGFSIPRMLGVGDRLGGAEGKIEPAVRQVGAGFVKVVSTGLIVEREESALMWRGLMLTKAVEQFLRDVRWGELDYLIVDLPPGTGDVQMGLARLLPRAEMIIVTTPSTSAQKVAIRAADMARRSYLRIVGVIENMSSFTCEHGHRYALFGEGGGATLASEIGAELLGSIPLEPGVAAGGDSGEPVALAGRGPAADAFRALADHIVNNAAPPFDPSDCTAFASPPASAAIGDVPNDALVTDGRAIDPPTDGVDLQ